MNVHVQGFCSFHIQDNSLPSSTMVPIDASNAGRIDRAPRRQSLELRKRTYFVSNVRDHVRIWILFLIADPGSQSRYGFWWRTSSFCTWTEGRRCCVIIIFDLELLLKKGVIIFILIDLNQTKCFMKTVLGGPRISQFSPSVLEEHFLINFLCFKECQIKWVCQCVMRRSLKHYLRIGAFKQGGLTHLVNR